MWKINKFLQQIYSSHKKSFLEIYKAQNIRNGFLKCVYKYSLTTKNNQGKTNIKINFNRHSLSFFPVEKERQNRVNPLCDTIDENSSESALGHLLGWLGVG